MMRPMSERESRLVAVLLLIGALVLADVLVVAPLVSGFAERAAEREELTARIAANDRMISAIPRLRRQAEASQRAMSRYVLTASDPASGADMLRDHLQNAIGAHGGEFRGGENLPSTADRVAARISATLGGPQLASLLADLQNAPPFLTIDSLTVSADEATIVGHDAALEIQLEASVPLLISRAR